MNVKELEKTVVFESPEDDQELFPDYPVEVKCDLETAAAQAYLILNQYLEMTEEERDEIERHSPNIGNSDHC